MILVTGGAGYIGSHTCVELLNAGYDIVVLDNFCNSKPEALKGIRTITGRDFPFYHAQKSMFSASGLHFPLSRSIRYIARNPARARFAPVSLSSNCG